MKITASKRVTVSKKVAVKTAAGTALRKYSKTFKDLAKYDRGERI